MSASAPLAFFLVDGDFLHHLLGDFFGRLRPGVDHLVVLLAMGDQTVIVLLLEILRQRARGVDDLPLAVRHHHVVLAERDAGLERIVEAERHDAVAEDHRLLLAAVTIDLVDHAGDFALGHQLVDDVVRNLRRFRQHVAEHHAAGRGLDPALGPILPVSSMPSQRYLILVWRWMTFECSACSSSAMSPKILPSPGMPSRMIER